MPAPVVLAAHGSRDPRSAETMRDLAAAVAIRRGAPVEAAFLDFNAPAVPVALRAAAAGGDVPVVVPALLTRAYHSRVDLPELLRGTGLATRVSAVLGPAEPGEQPSPLLVNALIRRLAELTLGSDVDPGAAVAGGCGKADGLVLIAAGTSHAAARSTVESVAAALSERLNVACRVGYASAADPTAAGAVEELRALGATRILAATYFLAAGRLYDAAAASARGAGALGVAAPLGAAPELVELVHDRVTAVTSSPMDSR